MLHKTLPHTADKPEPNEDIVSIAAYSSIVEADLIRSELAMADIEAWVANATTTQTFISMPAVGIQIQVRASDAERAMEIISGRADAAEDEVTADSTGDPTADAAPED